MVAEATYDDLVRQCYRVIVWCEMEKARLRAQLIALSVQAAFSEFMPAETAEQLEALIESIKKEIEEIQRMEDAAKAFLAHLRRVHGPIRRARGTAPAGGAEKQFYTTGGGDGAPGPAASPAVAQAAPAAAGGVSHPGAQGSPQPAMAGHRDSGS